MINLVVKLLTSVQSLLCIVVKHVQVARHTDAHTLVKSRVRQNTVGSYQYKNTLWGFARTFPVRVHLWGR